MNTDVHKTPTFIIEPNKKDVRKKHSRPSVVDDWKGTPTFDKEPKKDPVLGFFIQMFNFILQSMQFYLLKNLHFFCI